MARGQNTNQPFPPAPDFVPAVPQDLMDDYDLLASNLTPIVAEMAAHLATVQRLDRWSLRERLEAYAGCSDVIDEDEFLDRWIEVTGADRVWDMLAVLGIDPS